MKFSRSLLCFCVTCCATLDATNINLAFLDSGKFYKHKPFVVKKNMTQSITEPVCICGRPVNSFTDVSFIMLVYGENAFGQMGFGHWGEMATKVMLDFCFCVKSIQVSHAVKSIKTSVLASLCNYTIKQLVGGSIYMPLC